MSSSNSQNFIPCEEIALSSSYILSSSSKTGFVQKKIKKDTTVVSACNKVDVSETFNNSFVLPKGEGNQSSDIACSIIDNPSWGWIVLVFILVIRYRKGINVLINKIGNSSHGSVKAGPVEASWNTADEPKKFPNPESNQINSSANTIGNDDYYPSYDNILKNKVANKILSTLWFYQKKYGKGNDNAKRWSFRELNDPDFDMISLRLYWSGLIIANGSQYMLSNVGIRFCKKYESRLNMNESDLYSSFRI